MKKSTAFLIAIVLIAAFAGLIYYGVTNSRGTPVKIEKIVTPLAEVPFIAQDIDLAQGITLELWQGIKPQEIELMYQVTVLPWPKIKGGLPFVAIKAFHNKEDIYFYLRWPDDTEDRVHETASFSDAGAIMFPLEKKAQPHTIMMGFLGRVNIWHWKANQDREYWRNESPQTKAYVDYYYPFEDKELFPVSQRVTKTAVNDLLAIRVGTITPKDIKEVRGRGLMIGMEMKEKPDKIVKKCMERGLLVNLTAEKVLRFLPPLIITNGIIDNSIEILKSAIENEN